MYKELILLLAFALLFSGCVSQPTRLQVRVYEIGNNSERIPLAGAKVELYKFCHGNCASTGPDNISYTDVNGIATFDGIEAPYGCKIYVTKLGHSENITVLNTDAECKGKIVSLMLHKIEPLIVIVVSSNNIPIADATVVLYKQVYRSNVPVETRYTDSNGTVNFDGASPSLIIEVSKPGYLVAMRGAQGDDKRRIIISLGEMGPIIVYVGEGKIGSGNYPPITNARVDLYNTSLDGNDILVKTVYTNSSGIADFGKLNIRGGKVMANKEGYKEELQWNNTQSNFCYMDNLEDCESRRSYMDPSAFTIILNK